MKPFLRHQLERFAQRLGELDFLLSREDIMSDMAQYRTISREHAEVTQIAGRYARFLQREADLTNAIEDTVPLVDFYLRRVVGTSAWAKFRGTLVELVEAA